MPRSPATSSWQYHLLVLALVVATASALNTFTTNPTYISVVKGTSGQFVLALGPGNTVPSASVTVMFGTSPAPPGGLTITYTGNTGATCVFTATTTSCTVMVAVGQDGKVAATQTFQVTFSVTSTPVDPNYAVGNLQNPSETLYVVDNNAFTVTAPTWGHVAPNLYEGGVNPAFSTTPATFTFMVTTNGVTGPTHPVTFTPQFGGSLPCMPNSFSFTSAGQSQLFTCYKGWDDRLSTVMPPPTYDAKLSFTATATNPTMVDAAYTSQSLPSYTAVVQPAGFQVEIEPDESAVTEGGTAYFMVGISSPTGLAVSYQWQEDQSTAATMTRRRGTLANFVNLANGGNYNGATSNTLSVTTVVGGGQNGFRYRSLLYGNGGLSLYTTGDAPLTVTFPAGAPFGTPGASTPATSGAATPATTGAAAGFGDPHFVGWNGAMFDFDGAEGRVYNLLTDTGVQLNMRLGRLRASARDLLPGVYMREMGLKIGADNLVRLVAGGPNAADRGLLLFNGVSYNLFEPLSLPLNVSRSLFNGPCSIDYRPIAQEPASAHGIPDDFEQVIGELSVRLGDRYAFKLLHLERVGRYLMARRTLAIVGSLGPDQMAQPHGIIGQTAHADRKRAADGSRYKIEGSSKDYEVSSGLFGDDFTFNKF